MTKAEHIAFLREKAKELRIRCLDVHASHPGGSLSMADILTVLYYSVLRVDPKNPKWPDRDRFLLSKGHAGTALYCILAMKGYYEYEELKETYGHLHSRFQGHPDMKKTPGIEITAGSLGQGLSPAVGMAIAAKHDDKQHRIYCLLGDGECQEGQIWEAAMSAAHYKLDNLCAIVDFNKIQAKGDIAQLMEIEPFREKWESFGWDVIEVDGHDIEALLDAFNKARYVHHSGRPVVILAHTVKGKGVSFMENTYKWHTGAYSDDVVKAGIAELEQGEVY